MYFRYNVLLTIGLFILNKAICQENITVCNCYAQFEFIYTYIEANNPAFQVLRLDSARLNAYRSIKEKLLLTTSIIKDRDSCLTFLNQYIDAIKDHHTGVYKAKHTTSEPKSNLQQPFSFKLIDSETTYLKLTSFSKSHLNQLNSFYDSIFSKINCHPYLIIDLRDNGGGTDEGWHRLLSFIYTNKFETDKVDFWASKDNISHYLKDSYLSNLIADKISSKDTNTFVNIDKGRSSSFGLRKIKTPKKVVILQNKGVASSAEDFILYALQSKKVITLGENTGGYTGYGNVRSIYTPKKLFLLRTTTTKYSNGSKYEYVGIPPMYKINSEIDWMELAKQYLK